MSTVSGSGSSDPKWPAISDEVLSDSGDFIGQLQARSVDAFIAGERTKLAAIADDYTAWMFYPPTPHDDPAEYAPYWVRLSDLTEEQP